MIKTAYRTGATAALKKFGLDQLDSVQYQRPGVSSDGQAGSIDQAFQANADMGEMGQTADGFVSAVNNVLQPGSPPVGDPSLRHFTLPTDQSGGDL